MSVIVAKNISTCGVTTDNQCMPIVTNQVLVPAGTTVIVDEIQTLHYRGVKWWISVITVDETRARSYEVYATHQNGISASNNQYGIIGPSIVHTVQSSISGPTLRLTVTNNDTVDILVFSSRIGIPTSRLALRSLNGVYPTSLQVSLPASTTTVVDTIRYPKYRAAHWLISVVDDSGNKKTFEFFGSFTQTGSGASGTEYSVIGNLPLLFTVFVQKTGTNLELVIINTSVDNYTVYLTRMPVQVKLPATCTPRHDAEYLEIWIPDAVLVPTGTTQVVDDQIVVPGHVSLKWLASAYNPITMQTMCVEILATYQATLSSPTLVVYGTIGASMNVSFSLLIVGMDIILQATNNEANDVVVNLSRIPISV